MASDSKTVLRDALHHKQPSRIPLDLGGTLCTGMHVTCVAGLRDHYGLEKRPVRMQDVFMGMGMIDEDLAKAMGVDTILAMPAVANFGFPNKDWKEWRAPWGQDVLVPGAFAVSDAPNGDTLLYAQGDTSYPPAGRLPKGGYFFDAIIRQDDFDEDNLDVNDNLEEFQPLSEEVLDDMERAAREAEATGLAVVGVLPGTGIGDIALVPGLGLKDPKGIRDIEEWYISLVARPEHLDKIFAGQVDVAIENLKRVKARVGNIYEAVFVCGADFGTQTSTFCSADSLRDLQLPHYQRINNWIHENTSWKTMKHSCGAVEPLIEVFIEGGFDILNPVQCSATGMDPAELKRKYGSRLVFWGGGVDTQKTLPFGTVADVKKEVLERCRIFSVGGGFVFDAIHNIQALTPIENIVAMIDTVHEFNGTKRS